MRHSRQLFMSFIVDTSKFGKVFCSTLGSTSQRLKFVHIFVGVFYFKFSGQAVGERGIFWDGHESYPWLVLAYQIGGKNKLVCLVSTSKISNIAKLSSTIISSKLYFLFWIKNYRLDTQIHGHQNN